MAEDWKVKLKCEKFTMSTRRGNTIKTTARYSEIPLNFQISNNEIICPLCHIEVTIIVDVSRKYQPNECLISLKRKIKEDIKWIFVGMIGLLVGILPTIFIRDMNGTWRIICIIVAFFSLAMSVNSLLGVFRYMYFLFMLSRDDNNFNKNNLPSDVIYSRGNVGIKTKGHTFLHEKGITGPTSFYYYGIPLKGLVKPDIPRWG